MTFQNIINSEAFWLAVTALVGYLGNSVVSRGWVAKLPATSPIKRAIRALHGFLDRIDPMVVIGSMSAALALGTGCAGTLEESRAQFAVENVAGLQLKTRAAELSKRCQTLSDRAYWFGGSAKVGAAITGGAGLSVIPVQSEKGETAIAITTAGLAAITAGAVYFEEQAQANYLEEGCAQ